MQVIDPSTGAPLAGNVIPASRISPQARALLGLYPLPNFDAAARYNYQIPIVSNIHQDALQSRVNKAIGRKNQVSGMFAAFSSRGDTPNVFGFLDTNGVTGVNTNVNLLHRFQQRIFTSLGIQFSRMDMHNTPFFANRQNVSGDAGITGNNQEPQNWGPPTLSFAGGIAGSDRRPALRHPQPDHRPLRLHLWSHGSHNFTFGGDFRRQQFNTDLAAGPARHLHLHRRRRRLRFRRLPARHSRHQFHRLRQRRQVLPLRHLRRLLHRRLAHRARAHPQRRHALGIRLADHRTLRTPGESRHPARLSPPSRRWSPISRRLRSPASRYPDSLLQPDKHGFSPRIGFAWHPILASSLVVRGGYGVYYDTSVYQPIANQMAQQSPLSKSLSVSNGPENPLTLANGFYAPPNVTTNTFAIDPDFRIGYSQNWQLSVQRDLPGSLVVTGTYLGIKGTRAHSSSCPTPIPSAASIPAPPARPAMPT